MISLRKARAADAIAIGAVHVAAWRNTYPGILPDSYLANLSVSRQAAHYDAAIRGGIALGKPPLPAFARERVVAGISGVKVREDAFPI